FYHRYMASQKLVKEELSPLVQTYEDQLRKQQNWIGRFKWISPAIIAQQSLNQMAGTSTQDYENFRKQAVDFAEAWREHFMPFLYNNRNFYQKDYSNLPKFQYTHASFVPSEAVPVLLLISMALFGLGFLFSGRTKKAGILT
ncbi:MAG: DUF3526 domain-containing protein, partial [Flavobacteriaceae bacterium]